MDGSHVLTTSGSGAQVTAGSSTWSNYRVTASVKAPSSGYSKVMARVQNAQNFYVCGIENGNTLFLGKMYGGNWYSFATAPYTSSSTAWYTLSFTLSGTSLTCSVSDPSNASHTATVTTSQSYFAAGPIGAITSGGAEYDNYVVSAI